MATVIYPTRGIEKIGNFLQDVQYHSLMVNSASFNVRLMRDRKTRLPFLDSQTGVAQNSCKLYVDACNRMPGILFGQIYTYPAQRWCRKKRSYITIAYHTARETAEATEQIITAIENPPVSIMTEEINTTSMETKPHEMFFYDESNFLEEEDEEPDNEDDDTYSMRNTKKKKKCLKPPKPVPTKSTRGRKRRDPSTYKIITDADDDNPGKPYECALCGARYKTRQGLSYHLSHTHREGVNSCSTPCKNTASSSQSESLVADGSIILTDQNFPYQEQQQLISKQPDALSGLTDFQDNYLGYLSSSQESSASATASSYEPAVRRIVEAASEDDSLPFKEDSSECKLAVIDRSSVDLSEPVYANSDEELQKSNMKQLNLLPCNKIGDVATPNSYCDFCLGNANFNIKTGEPEEMVSCADCGRSGHLTCLQFTPNMIISVRHYRWQCIECKCCTLCGTSENDDKLLFCDDCDRGYHLYCLDKPLSEPPEGEWSCHLCQTQFHAKNI